jgi:hypothetical protein
MIACPDSGNSLVERTAGLSKPHARRIRGVVEITQKYDVGISAGHVILNEDRAATIGSTTKIPATRGPQRRPASDEPTTSKGASSSFNARTVIAAEYRRRPLVVTS